MPGWHRTHKLIQNVFPQQEVNQHHIPKYQFKVVRFEPPEDGVRINLIHTLTKQKN